jgi:hypothetical protein
VTHWGRLLRRLERPAGVGVSAECSRRRAFLNTIVRICSRTEWDRGGNAEACTKSAAMSSRYGSGRNFETRGRLLAPSNKRVVENPLTQCAFAEIERAAVAVAVDDWNHKPRLFLEEPEVDIEVRLDVG